MNTAKKSSGGGPLDPPPSNTTLLDPIIYIIIHMESGGGRVVKLLACGARGLGIDSPPRHLNFRDWLSPASKSRYGWNTAKAT